MSDVTTTAAWPAERQRRRNAAPTAAAWLAIGLLVGAVPAIESAAGVQTRYVLYGAVGAMVLGAAPYLAKLAGSGRRLLWVMLVVS